MSTCKTCNVRETAPHRSKCWKCLKTEYRAKYPEKYKEQNQRDWERRKKKQPKDQNEIVREIRKAIGEGRTRILVQSPTGLGKSKTNPKTDN